MIHHLSWFYSVTSSREINIKSTKQDSLNFNQIRYIYVIHTEVSFVFPVFLVLVNLKTDIVGRLSSSITFTPNAMDSPGYTVNCNVSWFSFQIEVRTLISLRHHHSVMQMKICLIARQHCSANSLRSDMWSSKKCSFVLQKISSDILS